MQEDEQRELAKLLSEAGAAHGVHEERDLKRVYDQHWPAWYAAYLVDHGIRDLLRKAITTEELAGLLARFDADYRAQQRQEACPITTRPN